MNKKLFKKVLTAVLTAALLFTSTGVASLNASAADNENILVKGVYTNFQKATMASQTTRQINAYVEPANATNQDFQYKSSKPEVAKVSNTGLITALSSGKTTITVTARDSSKQKETIEITVLKDLIITNKHVDSDNEVIILDETVGNLYIDTSVGDADIYLSGVTVRNILGMDSGDYSLYMYDSTAKELRIDEIPGEIESFASDDKKAKVPSLILGDNTNITDLNARISASIRQEDGSAVEGLRITQSEDGHITVYLENYSGGLLLDASLGDLEIVTTGCRISNVEVNGDENAGNVQLTDGGDSEIENLTLNGAANVSLGVPTDEVNIHWRASGASFSSNSSIGTLRNAGRGSNITLSGEVNNLEANGENGNINVALGGYVGTATINGAGNTLLGAGDVAEAYVNANNASVSTSNTLVTVGSVDGTRVNGKVALGGSTVATEPPAPGGGGGGGGGGGVPGVGPVAPEEPEEDGTIEINFDDVAVGYTYDVIGYNAEDASAKVIEWGTNQVLEMKPANYHNAAILKVTIPEGKTLGDYVKITYRAFWAEGDVAWKDVVAEAGVELTDLFASVASRKIGGYNRAAGATAGFQDEEFELKLSESLAGLSGEIQFALGISCRGHKSDNPANTIYYLDDIKLVPDMTVPVPISGFMVTPKYLTLDQKEKAELTATIYPSDFTTSDVITWISSDETVATVDSTGKVTAVGAGKATITGTTAIDDVSERAYSAGCTVTVTNMEAFSLNRRHIVLDVNGSVALTPSSGTNITWGTSDPSIATVINGTVTAFEDGRVTITATNNATGKSATCIVDVNSKAILIEDFEDGVRDSLLVNDFATLTISEDEAYDGRYSLLIETANQYNGIQYVFTNNTASAKKYQVSAFVKNAQADTVNVMLWQNGAPYKTYASNPAVGDEWVELNTGTESNAIEVLPGASVTARFKSDGVSKFYIDNIVITDLSEGDDTPPVDPDPVDENLIFETGFEEGDDELGKDGGVFSYPTDIFHTGNRSLKVVTTANYHGPQYTLDNSDGTEEVTYTVSSYVRKESETDVASVRYNMADDPWTTFDDIELTTEWQLFEVDITVAAGAKLKFRLTPIDALSAITYYVDDFKIVKATNTVAEKYFTDFYILQDHVYTGKVTKYLDGTNFRGLAQAGGVTGDEVLDKFNSWTGIKEVVKSYEITVEIISAQATTGSAITADILVQNKSNEGWNNSSYKTYSLNFGNEDIIASTKLTKTVVLAEETWHTGDILAGQMAVELKNIKDGTTPQVKVTIKVISNDKK